MGNLKLLFKLLPVVLTVLDAGGKLFEAIQSRTKAIKKDQNTRIEDQTISKQKERLIDVGYGFLPEDVRSKAELPEVKTFADKLQNVIVALHEAFESFVPITR